MTKEPNLSRVPRWTDYIASVQGTSTGQVSMFQEATRFVERQRWVGAVANVYVGFIFTDIVAVFLFEIEPAAAHVDKWIWVVVGDLPPAYIAAEDCSTPGSALSGYIVEMDEWAQAVEAGQPIDALIPVNAPATPEYAKKLKARLDFLYENILPLYEGS